MVKALKWVTTNFYIIFCIMTLIVTRGLHLPLVPVLVMLVFLYFPYVFINASKRPNAGVNQIYILGIYILCSLLLYIIGGYPIDIYFQGLYKYAFPVVFFFIAYQCSPKDREEFYKKTIYALLFTYIVGLYLYFFPPSWYMDWKTSALEGWMGDRTDSYINNYKNLSSFFSHSYFVGYTSFWALSYLLNKIITSPSVSLKTYIALIITILVLLLAQQRITVVLGFGLILFYSFLEIKQRRLRVTYLMILVLAFASYYIIRHFEELSFLLDRYLTIIDGTVLDDGRSGQWQAVYKTFNNYVFGEGFNIVGHEARDYDMPSIADGELFKTIYELGIVGSFIFYSFCAQTFFRALKHYKEYAVEIPIIIGFVAMQYGGNPFGMTNIIILFWFSAGIIWNKKIITEKIK